MVYSEFGAVEKPIIDWLQELGWKYVSPDDLRRDVEDPFDTPALKNTIKRLNPLLDDDNLDKVISQLRRPSNDMAGNKEFLEWVKGDKSLVLKPGEKATTIKLIDNENPNNNAFIVTNQFKFSGYENVRFDIVLM